MRILIIVLHVLSSYLLLSKVLRFITLSILPFFLSFNIIQSSTARFKTLIDENDP